MHQFPTISVILASTMLTTSCASLPWPGKDKWLEQFGLELACGMTTMQISERSLDRLSEYDRGWRGYTHEVSKKSSYSYVALDLKIGTLAGAEYCKHFGTTGMDCNVLLNCGKSS